MTPPNPNSAPVFIVASSAPPILVFNPAWKPVTTRFQYNNNVVKIPIISANSTDQIPTTALNSTFPNAFIPIAEKSKPLGYHFGIIIVNTLFITPTKISGINAISCCALVISMLLINGIFFVLLAQMCHFSISIIKTKVSFTSCFCLLTSTL